MTPVLQQGSRLGEYEIESRLRDDGDSGVYRAAQGSLGRTVVLHVMDGSSADTAAFRDRAEAVAALDHPNVLPVYEVGEVDGRVFAVLQDAQGTRVDEWLRSATPSTERARAVAAEVRSAIGALERAGVNASRAAIFVTDAGPYVAPLDGRGDPEADLSRLLAAVAPPVRRRRAAAGYAAVALAAVALAAWLATRGDTPVVPRTAGSDAVAARVTATVALGAEPVGSALAGGLLWIAIDKGRLLRVDPRRRQVVGAPIRLPGVEGGFGLRRGEDGFLWAAEFGRPGFVLKLDPETARVIDRVRVGREIAGGAISRDTQWITRTGPRGRAPSDLVQLDLERLELVGEPVPVGLAPYVVQSDERRVIVLNSQDGTLTRFIPSTGATRTRYVSVQLIDAILRDGIVWATSPATRTLTRVDAATMEFVGEARRFEGRPFLLASTRDAVWLLAGAGDSPEGPAALHRLDPATGRPLGRPLRLERGGFPITDGEELWLVSPATRSAHRITPVDPAPAAQPEPPTPPEPRPVIVGPLPPGRWQADRAPIPLTFTLEEPGWVGDTTVGLVLTHTTDRGTNLSVDAPAQIFAPDGGLVRLRSAKQFIQTMTRLPGIISRNRRTVSIGGLRGQAVTVDVEPMRDFPQPLCSRPCTALWPGPRSTFLQERGDPSQLTAIDHRGKTVVISSTPGDRRVEALIESIRFR